jgi:uracil-DNA glycosylase family 4
MQKKENRELDRDAACDALAGWLRMIELSGTEEIFLSDADMSGLLGEGPGGRNNIARYSGGGDAGGGLLESVAGEVLTCSRCGLHRTRKSVVFGEGDPRSRLMFIGEAPGADEDRQGRPFVGRAGQLLTRIIAAMGLEREETYITNVLKCRPPGNRNPEVDEICGCLPYLEKQIEFIQPEVICTLGLFATQTLTGVLDPIGRMRGSTYEYRGIPLIPTYHPAACLRNPSSKKLVWEDIKRVMERLGLPIQGGTKHGAGKSGRR